MLLPLSKVTQLTHLHIDCVPVACATLACILSSLSALRSLRMQVGRSTDTQKDAEMLSAALANGSAASGLCDLSICGMFVDFASKVSQAWLKAKAQLSARFIVPCLLGRQHLTRLALSKVNAHDVPCVVEHLQCMHGLQDMSLEWQYDHAAQRGLNWDMLISLVSSERVLQCCTKLSLDTKACCVEGSQVGVFWHQIACMSHLQHLEVPTAFSHGAGAQDHNQQRMARAQPSGIRTLTHLSMGCMTADLEGFVVPTLPTSTLKSFTASFENLSQRGMESLEEGLQSLSALQTLNISVTATHFHDFNPLDVLRAIVRQREPLCELRELKFSFTDLRRFHRELTEAGFSQLRDFPHLEHLDLHDCIDMDAMQEGMRAEALGWMCMQLTRLLHLSVPFASTWETGSDCFSPFCMSLQGMKSLRCLVLSGPEGVRQECLPILAGQLHAVLNLRTLVIERTAFERGRRRVVPEEEVEGMFSDPQCVQPLLAVLRSLPRFVCLRVNGGFVDVLQ